MTAEAVRHRWVSELTAGPAVTRGCGAAGEHLLRQLLTNTTIRIDYTEIRPVGMYRPDGHGKWVWSDLYVRHTNKAGPSSGWVSPSARERVPPT